MQMKKSPAHGFVTVVLAAGALVLSACGSDVAPPAAPDPVVQHETTGPETGGVTSRATDTLATISDCSCSLASYPDFVSTSCLYSWSTSGKATARCDGSIGTLEDLTKNLTVSGGYCAVSLADDYLTTSNSNLVIKPGGDATVSCRFK